LSAAADNVEAASSSAGMASPATAFFTRAMSRKRLCASSRRVRRRLSPPRDVFFSVAWEFLVFSYVSSTRVLRNVVLLFVVLRILLPSCHSCCLGSPPLGSRAPIDFCY
jgi:hypothetical protein